VNRHLASGRTAVWVALVLVTTIATVPTPAASRIEPTRAADAQSTAQDEPGALPQRCHPAETDDLELDVVVMDTGGADAISLQQAGLEVTSIWSTVGVRVVWSTRGWSDTHPVRVYVPVVIRPVLRRPGQAGRGLEHKGRPMGWVVLDGDGRPMGPMEIALLPIAASVLSGTSLGRRLVDMPIGHQQYAVGRGMGRVIAHEIGHWLFGRGHRNEGLMAPSLDTEALTVSQAPALPREWSATARTVSRSKRAAVVAASPPACDTQAAGGLSPDRRYSARSYIASKVSDATAYPSSPLSSLNTR
jgi:hypothetical protein